MRIFISFCLGLLPFAADAADIGSAYSKIEDDNCRLVAEYEAGATSVCEGHAGIWIRIDDGDARVSVIFGVDPDADPELGRRFESFQSFNNIGDVIEWRFRDGERPFAAILRWLISVHQDTDDSNERKTGQVLVISRVSDDSGPGCVVGYVDALVNKDANVMARKIADTMAADFQCDVDEPVYHGETGRLSGRPMRSTQ